MEPGRIEFIHRSWPADSAQLAVIRHELGGWLAPLRLTDEETADVVLAVDEAAVNAVLHAYGPDESGAVELTFWTEPGPGHLRRDLVHRGRRPWALATAGGVDGRGRPGHRPDEQRRRVGAHPLRRPWQPGAARHRLPMRE